MGTNAGIREADEVIDEDPGILKESRFVPHREPTSPRAVEPGIGEAEVQGEKDPRTVEKKQCISIRGTAPQPSEKKNPE